MRLVDDEQRAAVAELFDDRGLGRERRTVLGADTHCVGDAREHSRRVHTATLIAT